MKFEKNIILSIETTFEGGSLALYKGETEIDSWSGTKQVSKAEDILEQISELLKKNKIEKKHLQLIAVSDGSGSSTGAKIGLAIAKGLGDALAVKVVKLSVSESQLFKAGTKTNII